MCGAMSGRHSPNWSGLGTGHFVRRDAAVGLLEQLLPIPLGELVLDQRLVGIADHVGVELRFASARMYRSPFAASVQMLLSVSS
jgi:hypothetical protein